MRTLLLASAVTLGVATSAGATTIQVTTFDLDDFEAAQNALVNTVIEDFETLSPTGAELNENNGSGGFLTSVGTFSSDGQDGAGGTVDIPLLPSLTDNNDDSLLALRSRPIFSRDNTTRDGDWFLDSNDNEKMVWSVDTGSMFNRILFTLTDATDQGATLSIFADGGGSETMQLVGKDNGNAQAVQVSFDNMISGATIMLSNVSGNINRDGFGFDDATVGVGVVPLPAAAWMLLAGVGALGVAARRRKS